MILLSFMIEKLSIRFHSIYDNQICVKLKNILLEYEKLILKFKKHKIACQKYIRGQG